jgi:hypothetical protein
MELSVVSTSITEPISRDELVLFMGIPSADTSQDVLINRLITTARQWLERRTALSIVPKDYKVYFDFEDNEDGWFELPVVPVDATGTIICMMNGISTSYQRKGLKRIKIYPDKVFGTLDVGVSFSSYLEITFTAGETSEEANSIITELASLMFNHRGEGEGVNFATLPFTLRERINAISNNL